MCLLLVALLGACREHTVRVGFAPAPGTVLAYVVEVAATSDLRLEGQPPQRRTDTVVLDATHTILDSREGATRVRVELRDRAGAVRARTFIVRFDRAGQLTGIDQVEGLPADLIGDVGLSELFPAAAAAPPDHALAPGERWTIDRPLQLPGTSGQITGAGRLLELGVEDGREVATIASATTVELERTRVGPDAETILSGTQVNEASVTHAVFDGAVTRAKAVTRGRYDLRISPPSGAGSGLSVTGSLDLVIRSTTTRVA